MKPLAIMASIPDELIYQIHWQPEFGKKLRAIREEKGYTRLELSEELRKGDTIISAITIQKLENGYLKYTKTETILPILSLLNIDIYQLIS